MIRLMIDSDDLTVVTDPRFANLLVATYADIVTPELAAQLGSRLVVIDRALGDPHGLATVADIEPGAYAPANGVAAIHDWIEQGRQDPTAYHDRAQWQAVNEAGAGLNFAHWVATLDGTLVPGGLYMDAVQFAGAAVLGFKADLSVVWGDRWHPQQSGIPAGQLKAVADLAGIVSNGARQLLGEVKAL